ncbi:hypothetical protein E2I00_017646 [Balaenoptera physalus]|uniref:Uncharacterized protein n=1 Tax=Balaenoptera physalus TaxID=9770 RepID=A0A6A1QGQ5_BALPH|nr:hypothetical protein E2I00_017646 [Balaenoptera physalus]
MDTLDILVNKNCSMLWSSMNVRKDIFWLERLKSPALFYNGHHWLLTLCLKPEIINGKLSVEKDQS